MSNCAIYFDKDNVTYRLPVNPEQVETSSALAVQKYDVLKLGQVGIPTHRELTEYSFEAEFPHQPLHYVETSNDFKGPDFYLNLFQSWRDSREPVRFVSSNGTSEDIDALVLIEEIRELEKAGEEGDKYISFKLLEYRELSKKTAFVIENEILPFAIKPATEETNPKSAGTHVVVSGDTLWAIAKKYYGDGSKCNIIFHANKDKIKNPALIQVGWKLKIPDKSEFTKYDSPLPSGSNKSKKADLLKMAADFATSVNLGNVAGIGSSGYKLGESKKITIYTSTSVYNSQGVRGGTSDSGRSHSSGGRTIGGSGGAGGF